MKQPLTAKKPTNKPKTVISCIRWGRIHYVRQLTPCMGGTRFMPTYTDNIKWAMDFESEQYAQDWPGLFHPGAIRDEFQIQTLPVTAKSPANP